MFVIVFMALVLAGMMGGLVYLWDFSRASPARRAVPSGVRPARAAGAPGDGNVRTRLRAPRRRARRTLVSAVGGGPPAAGGGPRLM
ncbi:hypothetical protein LUX57_13700 [Actinomadura madurae]|uniref:hypothetical protein n=1 Tax=Actinomadura madurae TaxID=1993 RepID=UPI0020D24F0A|nr:hypothetical protein [Actinomadura madurae]MCP9966030.1 hypothetical protein [Actinomadura madurae]